MSKRKPKGLKVLRSKMPGRGDSFWYEGVVATYKGFELRACGDIRIEANVKVPHSCKWEDIAAEVKDDKGLERLVGSYGGEPDGGRVLKYIWENNNWFEVFGPDNDSFVADGDYDAAIDSLVEAADEYEKCQPISERASFQPDDIPPWE